MWQSPCYRIGNGPSLNRSCRGTQALVVLGRIIERYSKASFGSLRPVLAGEICPMTLALVLPPAGGACASGMRRASGSKSGDNSCPNWIVEAAWIGARVSSTGVSLPLNRGRRSRKNQAGHGHEVDGGGRRPRCAFGKPPGPSLAGGGDLGGANTAASPCAATRSGAPKGQTDAVDCRSRLRQRPIAPTAQVARHPAHLSAPQGSPKSSDTGRAGTPALPQAVESRTYVRLARQLPSLGRALRALPLDVSRLLPSRLPHHHPQTLVKPLLVLQYIFNKLAGKNGSSFRESHVVFGWTRLPPACA